jgi:hypothetical protein
MSRLPETASVAMPNMDRPFTANALAIPIGIGIGAALLVLFGVLVYARRSRRDRSEELPFLKPQADDADADGGERGSAEEGDGASSPTEDVRLGPRPMPPPEVLSESAHPAPLPFRSPLELHHRDATAGDHAHCWVQIPDEQVAPVRGATYMRVRVATACSPVPHPSGIALLCVYRWPIHA